MRDFLPPFLTHTRVLGALAIYFLLHVLWRVLVSDSAELDESEQIISAQSWSWGYAEQPPLYTWLQKLVFEISGWNVFSLIAFKSLLLFSTYYFVYRAAKKIWGEDEPALLSALCLLFIPQISWESQRDLTHSVLATATAAATLFIFVRLAGPDRRARRGHVFWYAALGLSAGISLLAKYNSALFLLALFAAACSLPGIRRRLFTPWLLLSAALFLLVTGPHLLWLSEHRTHSAMSKLTFSGDNGIFEAYLAATESLLQALIYFAGPIILLFFLLFFKRPVSQAQPEPPTEEARLPHRILLAVLAICLLAVIFFQAQFKARWLQPLLFLLPISLLGFVRPQLSPSKIRLLSILASVVALAILIVMPAIPVMASVTQRPTRLNAPWAELIQELKRKAPGLKPGVIVADSCLPGGNFKLHFPESLALAPECKVIPPPRNLPWLIVWEARQEGPPPPALQRFFLQLRGSPLTNYPPRHVATLCKYSNRKQMKLGYVLLPPAE